ncbi:MAG: hypothetical protein H0T73_03385, partial [Ardenticatenales bacterium]|nr:hypothetical protein [Ardenticatenales bacterium]
MREDDPPDIVALALADLTVPQLREIARGFGWKLSGLRREEVIAQMAAHYANPAHAASLLAPLPEAERRLLALLAWLGWQPEHRLLPMLHTLAGLLPAGWLGLTPGEAHLAEFRRRGLLLVVRSMPPSVAGVAPVLLPQLLPIPELLPPARALASLRPLPAASPLLYLLAAWQGLAEAGPVPPVSPFEPTVGVQGAQGWPVVPGEQGTVAYAPLRATRIPIGHSPFPASLRDALRPRLAPEPGMAEFFLALLIEVGLVAHNKAGHIVADETTLQQLLLLPADQQSHLLVNSCVEMPYGLWDEYSLTQQGHPSLRLFRQGSAWHFAPQHFSEHLAQMRSFFLTSLRWLPLQR